MAETVIYLFVGGVVLLVFALVAWAVVRLLIVLVTMAATIWAKTTDHIKNWRE